MVPRHGAKEMAYSEAGMTEAMCDEMACLNMAAPSLGESKRSAGRRGRRASSRKGRPLLYVFEV